MSIKSFSTPLGLQGKVKVTGSIGIDLIIADLGVVIHKIAIKSFQTYADISFKARILKGYN
jgi:hypothetical protein